MGILMPILFNFMGNMIPMFSYFNRTRCNNPSEGRRRVAQNEVAGYVGRPVAPVIPYVRRPVAAVGEAKGCGGFWGEGGGGELLECLNDD